MMEMGSHRSHTTNTLRTLYKWTCIYAVPDCCATLDSANAEKLRGVREEGE